MCKFKVIEDYIIDFPIVISCIVTIKSWNNLEMSIMNDLSIINK